MIDLPEDLARELEPKREDLADIIRRGLRLPPLGRLSVVEEVFEFLSRRPSPQQVLAFRPSERSTQRLRDLLELNRDGSLTPDQASELDALQSLNHLFGLLKLQAREELTSVP